MKRMIVLIFFLVMLITGCGSEENVAVTTDTSEAESEVVSFQTKEGIFCSLVYTGDYEWRLLAQKDEQPDINDIGAAQSLALYMDEEFEMDIQDIDISEKEDILIVTCEDDTYVEISTGEEFFIKFYAPSGIEICYVNELFMDADGNMILGGMLEDEAVYGGGQRFDTVNKRGTEMTLYIGDHWNDSSATYMTIPLFTTSRGMGMYINRYEGITADFGKACEDEWKISLQNDKLDCYFYTSGDMKDALTGYAKLTGNADIPEEWSCGTLICRYSPDLTEFDMDVQKSNKDGAPAGKSVKTLVTSLIDSGMKPSAVIMEGWKWGDVFEDSYKARTDREKLQETVDWLHEQGISAMIYMRVGGKLERTMPGLSGEYLVHANVTANGHTTSTTSIPDVAGDDSNPDVSSDRHFYLDITNPDAVNWYFDEIWGQLIEIGIDGVKIDFCELFPDSDYDYNGTVITYDWYDNSKIEAGSEHHAYPTYFISAFYKRMNELKEEKGKDGSFIVLSRGGGIGSQRNPFLWAGDQVRAFDKLDDSILAVINSGLSGVPFMTYDMAGYRYGGNGVRYADEGSLEYESEVFARAIEFTAFTLNIQTHGTVRNVYEMTEETQQIYRNFTAIHDELYEYIYKYSVQASETGIPAVRHLVLQYQDDTNVYDIKDEFMLGEGLLIAPILSENTFSREVYLPEGKWTNLLTGEVIDGGQWIEVVANLGQIPVFLNESSTDAERLREIFKGNSWKSIREWTDITSRNLCK